MRIGWLLACLAAACQPASEDGAQDSTPDPSAYQALMLKPDARQPAVEANGRECADMGGAWRRDGMLDAWNCFKVYSDGGLSCTSDSQCEGDCRIAENDERVGRCQADSSPFGCYVELVDGQSSGFICVD